MEQYKSFYRYENKQNFSCVCTTGILDFDDRNKNINPYCNYTNVGVFSHNTLTKAIRPLFSHSYNIAYVKDYNDV
jgi:hypothetical protein